MLATTVTNQATCYVLLVGKCFFVPPFRLAAMSLHPSGIDSVLIFLLQRRFAFFMLSVTCEYNLS